MAASCSACRLAGSTSSIAALALRATTTLTVARCGAGLSAHAVIAVLTRKERSRTVRFMRASWLRNGRGLAVGEFLADGFLGTMGGLLAQGGVHHRDEEERGERGDQQAADDGAAERGILLAAL